MIFQDLIIVCLVWAFIIFSFISYVYLFALTLYYQNLMLFLLQIPLWLLIVIILCISYYKSTFQVPGSPTFLTNMNYSQQVQQLKIYSRQESEQKKKRRKNKIHGQINLKEIQALNKTSYCFKCDVVKEKRVHHCSICNKCIIRMDHHCPWVGNCVGKYNHKYFILFLFYSTIGLTIIGVSITLDYLTGSYYADLLPNQNYIIWLYINCLSSYLAAFLIGFLFVTQMITVTENITTLQSFTQGIKQRNPWKHNSVTENLREIFGVGNWLLPTNPFPNSPKHSTSSLQQVVAL